MNPRVRGNPVGYATGPSCAGKVNTAYRDLVSASKHREFHSPTYRSLSGIYWQSGVIIASGMHRLCLEAKSEYPLSCPRCLLQFPRPLLCLRGSLSLEDIADLSHGTEQDSDTHFLRPRLDDKLHHRH